MVFFNLHRRLLPPVGRKSYFNDFLILKKNDKFPELIPGSPRELILNPAYRHLRLVTIKLRALAEEESVREIQDSGDIGESDLSSRVVERRL